VIGARHARITAFAPRPPARVWPALIWTAAMCGACATPASPGRFLDQPVVWRVDDARGIPEPAERAFYLKSTVAERMVFEPMIDSLDRPARPLAQNTNALDEAPDSTWFTNRIGVRPITAAEAARGPDVDGPPQPPFTIVKAKRGGNNPGFLMEDARGHKYLVKFDTLDNPEQQTASNVIVNRILWTIGYNVPADYVFVFRREALRVSDKARTKYGFDEAALDHMFSLVWRRPDGAYRATASQFLDGVPKGGWPEYGVRADDPNDRVPHQHRRELRGLRLLSAWLGHTDMKEDNTLDMYVQEGERRFLRHYLVDFGEALGGHQSEKNEPQIGWEHAWDWRAQLRALVSFGLWVRPWERQVKTPWLSVGWFAADHFDPRTWRGRYAYGPFRFMDRADAFWAAKLAMRVERPIIEAIVAEGQLSEPAAARHLVDALLTRRRKIGAAYLDGVTPLDELRVEPGGRLCGVDLSRRYGFASEGVVEREEEGRWRAVAEVGADGAVCLPISASRYQIARVRIRRGQRTTPPLELHVGGAAGAPRLLGIVR
jgi:hypothetical protein